MISNKIIAFGNIVSDEMVNQYISFTAEQPNSSIMMVAVGNAPSVSLCTSYDGYSWLPFIVGSTILSLPNIGDKVYFRAVNTNERMGQDVNNYNTFSISGQVAANGNIQSLLGTDEITADYCFCRLFYNCSSLTSAPELTATTLAGYCYSNMFQGCTSLVSAPELPATTMAGYCYNGMFQGCTSLVNAPELPAMTLVNNCYQFMFKGCTSLVNAPELPAMTLVNNCYSNMFQGCTSLVNAPELPATTLTQSCYYYMFQGCKSLVNAPELPAMTLVNNCYSNMFQGCTSLVNVTVLPATTLVNYCYSNMFNDCTSLVSAPELPATTLVKNCYQYMFQGCKSLVNAPVLPATTLASYCYQFMFKGCTSLTQAPELPATTLAGYCYNGMFQGCKSLTQAPELPATTLIDGCYQLMFKNCSLINEIITAQTSFVGCNDWLNNVSQTGTFKCLTELGNNNTIIRGSSACPDNWLVNNTDSIAYDGLYFTAEEAGSTVKISKTVSAPIVYLETSPTGKEGSWSEYIVGVTPEIALANVGDKVYFRAKQDNKRFATSYSDYNYFVMTGKIAASGNINTLLKADGSVLDLTADDIDRTYCYFNMFINCSSLTKAPELPATTLANNCYTNIFFNCSSLTKAPELPATTLANGCYYNMFYNCTSLTQAPVLPAMTLKDECYRSMFYNCTSLTKAPELPATTLSPYCYHYMFADCLLINEIITKQTTFENCISWLKDVSRTGMFYCSSILGNNNTINRGISACPEGWMVVNVMV